LLTAIVVAVAGYGASFLPSIYAESNFWTTSPTFFWLRAGLITLALPLACFWDRSPWRGLWSWSPAEELGRSSLFVYWIHVEMVYGFISRHLRGSLSLEGALLADLVFSGFLLSLVLLENWLVSAPAPYLAENKSVI
jgi:fucose 4-O-acetylase-like acetyltransferase